MEGKQPQQRATLNETPLARVLAKLGSVRRSGNGYSAKCPAHEDREPSLSVTEADDRRVLLYDHGGCTVEAIVAALGLTMADLFPSRDDGSQHRKTVYVVRDADGRPVAEHVRVDHPGKGKRMWWRRPGVRRPGLAAKTCDLPLYGVEQLRNLPNGATVVITEGERACLALRERGIPAVATVTGASGTPSDAVLGVLVGYDVVLWPDADDAGGAHMARIATRLGVLGTAPRHLTAAGAAAGDDAADVTVGTETVRAWLGAALAWSASADAATPTILRLAGAMSVLDAGKLAYILRRDERLTVVTSSGDVFDESQARAQYNLAKTPDVESRLSDSALDAIRKTGIIRPDGVQLFSDLRALLARHIEWPSPHVPALLALWVIGTYCFRLFVYFAYVVLSSMAKRSGKSLVLEMLAELAFNATDPTTAPTPAAIYRDLDANHATLLLDEIESLGDRDKDDRAALLAVLNLGFKSNAAVARVEKRGNRFVTVRYNAYSPKAFAGIKRPADTIRDRSVMIHLKRKPRGRKLPRFNIRRQRSELQDLRDRLHLFALATSADVLAFYDDAEQLAMPVTLDDRARDILEPLYAIAAVIDVEAGEAIATTELTNAVKVLMLDRSDDTGDEATLVRALEALRSRVTNGTGALVLSSAEAVQLFNAHELEWVTEPKHARGLLQRLGFRSGSHRVPGKEKPVRGYKVTDAEITDLWERYGSTAETADEHQVETGATQHA